MNNENRKLINLRDGIIVTMITAAAIAGVFLLRSYDNNEYAVISCDNTRLAQVPLNEDKSYSFPEAEGMVFTVSDGKISVSESSCSDGICEKTGAISGKGQAIVCVPNKITVTIEGNIQNDLDVVLK